MTYCCSVDASHERVDDATHRSAAMASALGTVLRQMGVASARATNALDKTLTFNQREKKTQKLSKAGKKEKEAHGHHLQPQQYFAKTLCYQCATVLWGVGHQGLQCSCK